MHTKPWVRQRYAVNAVTQSKYHIKIFDFVSLLSKSLCHTAQETLISFGKLFSTPIHFVLHNVFHNISVFYEQEVYNIYS